MKHNQLAAYSWKKVLQLNPEKDGEAPWETVRDEDDLYNLYLKEKSDTSLSEKLDYMKRHITKGFLVADLLQARYEHDHTKLSTILEQWFEIMHHP